MWTVVHGCELGAFVWVGGLDEIGVQKRREGARLGETVEFLVKREAHFARRSHKIYHVGI